MGKLTQQGIAAWVVILAILGVIGLSAVGGVVLLQKFDNEATEEADRETRTPANPYTSNNQQPHRSGEKAKHSESGPEAAATKSGNRGAPVTEVDLTLKGVITRSDPKRSRALIAKGNEAEQAYLPGDSVLANVSLESVVSDHVVLKVNGHRETLYLNRTLEGRRSSNDGPASKNSSQQSLERRPLSLPPTPNQSIETDEDEDYLEDEDEDWDDEDWDEDDWDLDEEDEDDW